MNILGITVNINSISRTSLAMSMRRTSVGSISVSVNRRSRKQDDLEITTYAKNEDDVNLVIVPLEEMSENVEIQPIYVIFSEYGNLFNGFYRIQNVRRRPIMGGYFVEEVTFEMVKAGNSATHMWSYNVKDLSTVTNDWNI